MSKFCHNCGKEVNENQEVCLACGCSVRPKSTSPSNNHTTGKSKIAAGLLGIFLGIFGVHNFYLGYTGKGTAQLLITILTCGIGSIITSVWGVIEGILILTGSINTDGYGNPLVD